MSDTIEVPSENGRFSDLVKSSPNFLEYQRIYNDAANQIIPQNKGPMENGTLVIPEFSEHREPSATVARRTNFGDLSVQFGANGQAVSADLKYDLSGHHIREHVTLDANHHISADDLFQDSKLTAHTGFDEAHRVREVFSQMAEGDTADLSLLLDANGAVTQALEHKTYGDIYRFYNENRSKRIISSSPSDRDVNTFLYDLKTSRLKELDIDKGDGHEVRMTRGPHGKLVVEDGHKI